MTPTVSNSDPMRPGPSLRPPTSSLDTSHVNTSPAPQLLHTATAPPDMSFLTAGGLQMCHRLQSQKSGGGSLPGSVTEATPHPPPTLRETGPPPPAADAFPDYAGMKGGHSQPRGTLLHPSLAAQSHSNASRPPGAGPQQPGLPSSSPPVFYIGRVIDAANETRQTLQPLAPENVAAPSATVEALPPLVPDDPVSASTKGGSGRSDREMHVEELLVSSRSKRIFFACSLHRRDEILYVICN
jgi:hypothetical protein